MIATAAKEWVSFSPFATAWEQLERSGRARWGGFEPFYRALIESAKRTGRYHDTEAEIVAEQNWLVLRKPYYKLWAGYAVMLSRTSLALPIEVFRVPHDAFAIFMPARLDLFRYEHAGRLLEIRSILVSYAIPKRGPHPCLTVVVDDGEENHSRTTIWLTPGRTIENCLAQTPFDGSTSHVMMATALRLAVAVSLLAISVHRCVEHDVIAALRDRYDRASSAEERKRLADKSRQRGINGWCIGRGRCLSLVTRWSDDEHAESSRQLTYQHIRGGHFHTVLHGPGKSQRKVMFFEPTIVRPDLPPPPLERVRSA